MEIRRVRIMRIGFIRALAILLSSSLVAGWIRTLAQIPNLDLPTLARNAGPTVMLLTIYGAGEYEIGSGTGFVISSDGKLVTNYHVIQNAWKVTAKSINGARFNVEGILSSDPQSDLALLKLEAKDLTCLQLADSSEIKVGQHIAVIGNPLGLEGTLTEGIVSASREDPNHRGWLQITAAISSGSSGSPVLNDRGEVVGVATFVLKEAQSLNFAVPSNFVRQLVDAAASAIPVAFGPVSLDESNIIKHKEESLHKQVENSVELKAYWKSPSLKTAQDLVLRFPEYPLTHLLLGNQYAEIAFYDDAVAAYRKSIKYEPRLAITWRQLGTVLAMQKNFAEAIISLEQGIKLDPSDATIWKQLVLIKCLKGDFNGARIAWNELNKLNPLMAREVPRTSCIQY